ncbi:MAG: hypothetical protein FWD51_03820, partial [Betaproteobacteria bacterium]|nr:hypothetical protein [Betaproteobacteria bacterium]
MRLIKKLLKISLVLCLSACVAVALLYALQSYGVCLKKGRVLSPEELRKEVLLSFVKLEIHNSDAVIGYRGSSGVPRVSIGHYDPEVGIEKILEKIYLGETSIEESLGLEPLGKVWKQKKAKTLSEEQIKEPFILVIHESVTSRATDDSGLKILKGSTNGAVFISSNLQEEIYERKGFFSKLGSVRYFFENPNSFYNTLCGYYNNYYYNQAYAFSRECT